MTNNAPNAPAVLNTHYIVQAAATTPAANCWGTYKRIAVLEVEAGLTHVAMISPRARGCVRVVATWEKLNVGTTDRCAYRVALKEAREMAEQLNAARFVGQTPEAQVELDAALEAGC